jgi:hypothetical protein
MDYFKGRTLFLISKHRKEDAVFTVFNKYGNISCKVFNQADTDELGTFTGEIPRHKDPVSTVRLKSKKWISPEMEDQLLIATEGSFGPHPHLFFIPAHQELIHFADLKNGWELTESILSTETNFSKLKVKSQKELLDFAKSAQFPSHALIIRTGNPEEPFIKGISNEESLIAAFNEALKYSREVEVETDMRAMNNPSRMRVIEKLTEKLFSRLLQQCSQCQTPGFGFLEPVFGLICELCGDKTLEIEYEVHGCVKCNYREIIIPEGRMPYANPANCPNCNP